MKLTQVKGNTWVAEGQELIPLYRMDGDRCILLDTGLESEREELEELYALSPADRAVIHLHYYQGYSTGEIAQLLGQRPGTIRARLVRARGRLKRLLEGELL